jgi:histidinol-phosphatase (PHP family)
MCPKEAIAAVKKMGLGIAFAEHVDFAERRKCVPPRDPNSADAPRGIGDFICDFSKYPEEYLELRGEDVMVGLEFGLTKAFLPKNKKIAEGDYDFIIGSVHSVDGVELYNAAHGNLENEPFARQLTSGIEINAIECIRRYLIYSREMVEISDYFDSFGHIDYIARYVPLAEKNFFYEKFAREFDALLKRISERGLALEINTNLFGGDGRPERVMQKICERFYELGGRTCTIGSDAHKIGNVAKCVDAAKTIAVSSGLVPVYFKERKAIRCE